MGKYRIYLIFSLLLIIVFIVPFVYVSRFPILNLDDFCRATLQPENYFLNIKDWYFHHNGRFINAAFTLLPVYQLNIYRLIIALQFFILGLLLYNFLSSIFRLFVIDVNKDKLILLSVLFYIVLIAYIPSPFDFFYWFASVSVYLFSFYFFLLFLQNCLEFYFTEKLRFFLLLILVIFSVGNNELLIGITNMVLLVLILVHYYRHKRWKRSLIFLNIIGVLSSFVVIFAPGTTSRSENFNYGGNLYGSLIVSITRGGKFLIESIINLPLILFFVFLFFMVYQNVKPRENNSYMQPLWVLGITYAIISTVFFTLFFATGSLDVYAGRIGNFTHSLILVLLTLNIINLAAFVKIKLKRQTFNLSPVYYYLLIPVFLILILLSSNNYVNLQKDFTQDNFKKFETSYQDRMQQVTGEGKDSLTLIKIEETYILRSGDIDINNKEWVKDCYIRYLNNLNKGTINNILIK